MIEGFAFMAGLFLGVIIGTLIVAYCCSDIENRKLKSGFITSDGVVYRVTRVER